MNELTKLYEEFRRTWSIDKVKAMELPDYTKLGSKDTFTYWVEFKTETLGSIRGSRAFKFGIFSRDAANAATNRRGRMYSGQYAWWDRYGSTADLAFESVKAEILKTIEAAQSGNLDVVEAAMLAPMFKWKLAFLYQPDLSRPIALNIFNPVALEYLAGEKLAIGAMHRKILERFKGGDFFEFAASQWERFSTRGVQSLIDDPEKRKTSLNTIYYGPPGTGKTWQVLKFLEGLRTPVKADTSKPTLVESAKFWHLAPGRNGYLWDQLKNGDRLGYEWCGMGRGDLTMYSGANLSIVSSFSKVKAGDYFCVISGPKLLGLAKARHDYDFARAASDAYNFQTIEVDWIEKFDTPVRLNSTQTKTFCVLNYGRRWDSLKQGLEERGYRFSSTAGGASGAVAERRTHYLVTFHQSYSYEDFIEGIKPVMDHEAEEEEGAGLISYAVEPGIFYRACDMACQFAGYADLEAALRDTREGRQERFAAAEPFYLVIDEINRGNVANIFGELITLVETDKRLGNENELIVELPYSKTSFGVPSNLYLIGTMNTADRSVEALDAALRRRFSFVDCPPDPSAIANPDGFEVDLRKLLEALNSRIELVLDRDHRIGHAYFTDIAESEDPLEALREAFRLKVIPQLEEYCYGATEKIARILGPGFVQREKSGYALFEGDGEGPDDDRSVWKIEIPADAAAFKALYEQGIRSSS